MVFRHGLALSGTTCILIVGVVLLLLLVLFVLLVLLLLLLLLVLVLVVVACKCQLRNDHWAKNTQLCATSISGGASKNRPLVYCEPPKNNPQAAHQDLMLSLFPAKIVKWYFNVCVCMYIYIERERETCSYTHAWTHKIGLSWQETIQFYPIWGKNSHLSSSVPDAITVWPRVRALGMAGWLRWSPLVIAARWGFHPRFHPLRRPQWRKLKIIAGDYPSKQYKSI